jgi:predicted  nucleic acid-binding Zn-ribbon protein
MSTVRRPLRNPTSSDISQLQHEIVWLEDKISVVREEMKKRPSKIKQLNDLQRQVDHAKDLIIHYNKLK